MSAIKTIKAVFSASAYTAVAIFAVAAAAITPSPAYALEVKDLAPLYSPLCWERKICEDFGGRFSVRGECSNASLSGFLSGIEMGECSVSSIGGGKTYRLNVPLLGAETVNDVGDFIRKAYIVAVGAAVIIAVIKIIHSGLTYATSAGSAEAVESAVSGIKGAILGLLLLLGSYLILLTISPDLVVLKPPALIKSRSLELIAEQAANLLLAKAIPKPQEICPASYILDLQAAGGIASCGTIVPLIDRSGSSSKTCMVTFCDENSVCLIQVNSRGELVSKFLTDGRAKDNVSACRKDPFYAKRPPGTPERDRGEPVYAKKNLACSIFESGTFVGIPRIPGTSFEGFGISTNDTMGIQCANLPKGTTSCFGFVNTNSKIVNNPQGERILSISGEHIYAIAPGGGAPLRCAP